MNDKDCVDQLISYEMLTHNVLISMCEIWKSYYYVILNAQFTKNGSAGQIQPHKGSSFMSLKNLTLMG